MGNKTLTPWQRFVGLIKLERKDILQISYYAIFEGVVSLSLPLGIQTIVNLMQGAQVSASWFVLVFLVTVGVAFSGVLKLMQLRIIETIQQRIFVRSSLQLSYQMPKIKMTSLRNEYLPELANRFFDTLTIQKGLSKFLLDVPSAVLQIVFALILLSFYHPFFIIFGVLLLALIYALFKLTAQKGLDTSLNESKNKYRVAHWLQEIARSVVSFKLSGDTNLALDKSDTLVEEYLESRESHFKILIIQFTKMISFKVLITSGLLLIGGFLVLKQQMNIGQFVAAEIIILLIIASVEKLILGLESFYDVLTSVEKLGLVFDMPSENQFGEVLQASDKFKLELTNICYDNKSGQLPVLKNISFDLNEGDRMIIEGMGGSGKSTLLQILSGIVPPTSGRMVVNNNSIESLKLSDYRSYLGLSLLDETPFEGTIRENITFGDTSITDNQIFEVMKRVGLLEFVQNQSKGLSSILKPEGKHIPGSISKKIVLARAITLNPKILILEDALDLFNENETKEIIDYLSSPDKSWILVVVTDNKLWKSYCNKALTLVEGEILN